MSKGTSQEEEKQKRKDYLFCHLNSVLWLVSNHCFLKAYKVVSGSEYPLCLIAGFQKAGGEDQVPLSPAQPRFFLSYEGDCYAKRRGSRPFERKHHKPVLGFKAHIG